MIAADGLSAWAQVFRTIQGFEAWQAHGAWIEPRSPKLSAAIAGRFEAASRISGKQYRAAEAKRGEIREQLGGHLGDDTVIVLPTLPTIAPRIDAGEAVFEDFRARALPAPVRRRVCRASRRSRCRIGDVDGLPARPFADRAARAETAP